MKERLHMSVFTVLAFTNLLITLAAPGSLLPLLQGPSAAFLNSRVAFRCFSPGAAAPVTYKLTKDGKPTPASARVDLRGNQTAQFLLKVTAASEGSYRCTATAGGRTGSSNAVRLRTVIPASNTRVTSEPHPPVVFEGSRLVLSCSVGRGSHLSYTWFFNRKEVTASTPPFLLSVNQLVVERATAGQAGRYYCTAWSTAQNTRRFSTSAETLVTVKAHVSKPQISFSLFKHETGYQANVSCRSSRGSPPVNVSLRLDDREVASVWATESPAAWFSVDVVPGLDMGDMRCHVRNEAQDLTSEPLTLEVVPVGGKVEVQLDYLYTTQATLTAVRLKCHISRGTFPLISWIRNGSELTSDSGSDPSLSRLAFSDRGRTVVLTGLSPEGSGFYGCRVRDEYDSSAAWLQSAAVLVQVTNRIRDAFPQGEPSSLSPNVLLTPTEVIAVTFCCFFALMLAVASVCLYKMFDDNAAHPGLSSTNSAVLPMREPKRMSMGPDSLAAHFHLQSEVHVHIRRDVAAHTAAS